MRPLLPILALALLALPVSAAPQTGQAARLQAEFRDEQARARRLRAEAAQAATEIAALERELAGLRAEVGVEDAAIAAQRARLRDLGAREGVLAARLAEARGRHLRLLSALQMMSRRPPPPLLIPSDRAVDTVRAAILMKAMSPELQRRAQGIADRQGEIVRIRRLAALDSEKLFTAESARGDRRAEIQALAARQTALRAVLRAEAGQAERAAAVLEARLRATGTAVPAVEAEAPTASAALPAGRRRLTPPANGIPYERFGGRSSGWRWRADGETARAPAAGRVAYAGPLSGWGQVIIVDLGPGWRAVVAGLETVSVEAGARVDDGQALGASGPDGEIYFELRRDERPIDPGPWLG